MTYSPFVQQAYSTGASYPALRQTSVEMKLANAQPDRVGRVPFDAPELAGATDEDTFTNVRSYAAAQTNPPVIELGNRTYNLGATFNPYTGFRLLGQNRIANSELGAANSATIINLSTNGIWCNVHGGNVYDALISGITFIGSSGTSVLASDDSSIWHCCQLENLSFHQCKTALGTQAAKLLMTASLINGWFQMQGMYNGGVHIGGSDNDLFVDGALADGSQAFNTAGNATGQAHFWFDGMDNTGVGRLYITATGLWTGILYTGSAYNSGVVSNRGMCDFWGVTNEGQSASLPCDGALLRVQGGILKWHGGYIARGMSDPTALGHTPTDAGVVHVTGGYLGMEWVTYDRANGVAESVPFIYNDGGYVDVSHVSVATTGGTWTGLPQVHNASGTLIHDASVAEI